MQRDGGLTEKPRAGLAVEGDSSHHGRRKYGRFIEYVLELVSAVSTLVDTAQVESIPIDESATVHVHHFFADGTVWPVRVELMKHPVDEVQPGAFALVRWRHAHATQLRFALSRLAESHADDLFMFARDQEDICANHDAGHRLVHVPESEVGVITFEAVEHRLCEEGVDKPVGAFYVNHMYLQRLLSSAV